MYEIQGIVILTINPPHFFNVLFIFSAVFRITKLAHYWLQRGNKSKGATDPILSVYLKQGDIKVR